VAESLVFCVMVVRLLVGFVWLNQFDIHVVCRKYLEMPNGQTEAVNLMMTDNIIV
jgi:hypothetical protein